MSAVLFGLTAPFSLIERGKVGSTNDEARALARQGASAFTVVWAREQGQGRGRTGRSWASPPGNLYCSYLIDGGSDLAIAPQLSFVAAVSVVQALSDLALTADFRVKWPNDVLCNGRKICGMLLERTDSMLILGIGVNVQSAPDVALYPTNCLAKVGCGASVFDVLAAVSDKLAFWVGRWRTEGFAPVRAAWLASAAGVGGEVTVRLAQGETCTGRFYGLDAEGALLVDTPDGARRKILAGDVFFTS